MRLVAMPANSDTLIIFRAQDLPYRTAPVAGEGFDPGDEGRQPVCNILGVVELALAIFIAPA
jgi:hypothetical protein